MKPTRVILTAFVALIVLVAAACGGNKAPSVPSDAVAVVDGTPITKAEMNALLARAKTSYATNKRAFPKAGTAEYQSLETQAVAFLVQRAQYQKQADNLKLTVTDKEIQDRIDQVKKQYFAGSQSKLEERLKATGYTMESFTADIKAQLVSEKIYQAVTKNASVTDAQAAQYYKDHKSQYVQQESRDVRHILVKTKAEADKIYAELKAGGDFAALAKKNSIDPGSKANGGKLTITKGQTVPEFDKAAFTLKTNEVSKPVKTQYGYHVIQPLSPIRPAATQPFKAVSAQIKAQLLETAKNDLIAKWTADTKKTLGPKTAYASGFAPPATATDTTPVTTG
jgi:foldase protein PrsA